MVFRSGREAVSVAKIVLWGSWAPCLLSVSYLPEQSGEGGVWGSRDASVDDRGPGVGSRDWRGTAVSLRNATWVPLRVYVNLAGVRNSASEEPELKGQDARGQVGVGGADHGGVELHVVDGPVRARGIRVQPLGLLRTGAGNGSVDSEKSGEDGEGREDCRIALEEISVL